MSWSKTPPTEESVWLRKDHGHPVKVLECITLGGNGYVRFVYTETGAVRTYEEAKFFKDFEPQAEGGT